MNTSQHKFGTAPVFFTAISTILGAIMFLRFGYAVGTTGVVGAIAIVLIGHAVTIPTAMAISEIATNSKVEGGGAYYIISRSFGLVIGSTIGIALYLSQGISVAFYVIAFTEAFTPIIDWLFMNYKFQPWAEWILLQPQTVSIPTLLLLTWIVIKNGADVGIKTLYIVVATLLLSLIAFFLGDPIEVTADTVLPPIPEVSMFTVFAIIFPAFTGIIAGVGLSGDLKEPGKSIPLGTLAATLVGMLIYLAISWKLSVSAPNELLADTSNLVMADIAIQGWWIIPLGLAAATLSSTLGSIIVAPRTLQAIAKDNIIPIGNMNSWLAEGKGESDEPINSYIVTFLMALVFLFMGALDAVAEIISMFFMVTYGSLCLISFLQHFAADPSYRPTFKSKWYISLFGAIACFGLMFFMNSAYAFTSIILMVLLYLTINAFNADKKNIALIFQGVMYQISRKIHVFLQKSDKEDNKSWRPSAVFLSSQTFASNDAFLLTCWLSYKFGFGTYIHHMDGYFSRKTNAEAKDIKKRMIKMAQASKSEVYIDTLINPAITDSIGQVVQLPSISGTENNMLLFDHTRNNTAQIDYLINSFKLIQAADFDIGVLSTSPRKYGFHKEIHVWITSADVANSNLMILLAYVTSAHPDWKEGEIKVFSAISSDAISVEREKLNNLIAEGQLPISKNNIEFIEREETSDLKATIKEYSQDADFLIIGFVSEALKRFGAEVFSGYEGLSNILFVNTKESKQIK